LLALWRDVNASFSLEVFKVRLDGALGILIWCLIEWLATLIVAGELEVDDL